MLLVKSAVGIFAMMFAMAHGVEILRVATSTTNPEGTQVAKLTWYLGHSSCVCLGLVIAMIMFRSTQDALRRMAEESGPETEE